MPMINSKNKFEMLVWQLMKGLARNCDLVKMGVEEIWKVGCECDLDLATTIT